MKLLLGWAQRFALQCILRFLFEDDRGLHWSQWILFAGRASVGNNNLTKRGGTHKGPIVGTRQGLECTLDYFNEHKRNITTSQEAINESIYHEKSEVPNVRRRPTSLKRCPKNFFIRQNWGDHLHIKWDNHNHINHLPIPKASRIFPKRYSSD